MKRPLIILLILLVLFAIFFYFSLGSKPQSYAEIEEAPNDSHLDSVIRQFPTKYPYVYLKDVGYVLKDRRIVFVDNKSSEKDRQAEAIASVEKELESYWKWQIISGNKSLGDINPTNNDPRTEERTSKNIFNRILDVFKVADAVIVTPDKSKTCDCDNDLLMLAGSDLHLLQTTLNPGDGAAATKGNQKIDFNNLTDFKDRFIKQTSTDPQMGRGKYQTFMVGIIDTGINFSPNTGQLPDSAIDYNFLNHTSDVKDDAYITHGTYIANIIAKYAPKGTAKLVGLKTYDDQMVGNLFDNLCAILYCTKNKIRIANASWGIDRTSPLFEIIMQKVKIAEMTVVCSAGNDSVDIDVKPWYPACYANHPDFGNNIISVTSKHGKVVCENTSSSEKRIDFSVETDENCKLDIPEGKVTLSKTGTSYAAPYVVAELLGYKQTNSALPKANFLATTPVNVKIKKFVK